MEIQTLKRMLVRAERMVRVQMNEIGEVCPGLFCQRQDGEFAIIGLPEQQPTKTQRRLQALAMGDKLRAQDMATYVVVQQQWMKEVGKGESQISVPDSFEGFEVVELQAHNIKTCLIFYLRVDRTGGKPQLTPLHLPDARKYQGGTWDNLLMDPSALH